MSRVAEPPNFRTTATATADACRTYVQAKETVRALEADKGTQPDALEAARAAVAEAAEIARTHLKGTRGARCKLAGWIVSVDRLGVLHACRFPLRAATTVPALMRD